MNNQQEWFSVIVDALGGFGDLLGGVAAITAVIVAICAGRSELRKWRNRQRTQKRAEIAGKVIGASLRMLSALKSNASIAFWAAPAEDTPRPLSESREERRRRDQQSFAVEVSTRWALSQEAVQQFYDAFDLAVTYLPEGVSVLEEIEHLLRSVRAHQETYIQPQVYGESPEVELKGFGANVQERIRTLRQTMLDSLGPMARLEVEDQAS